MVSSRLSCCCLNQGFEDSTSYLNQVVSSRLSCCRIIKALERIIIRPEVHVKKLFGDPGYRLRVGVYRAIIDIKKEKLIILAIKIGHRKNIYKKL